MIKLTTLMLWISVIALISGGIWGAYQEGLKRGIQMYHTACYEVGGILIDKNLTVVKCQGLIALPKDEEEIIQKDLDKDKKI
jgi:hypothetical protein